MSKLRSLQFPALAFTLLVVVSIPASADTFNAKIRNVTDGDTLVLTKGGRAYVVQLAGIDAPEIGQEYGDSARNHVHELTKGKKVQVEVVSEDGRHAMTAHIKVDGKDLAASLVENGLAWANEDGATSEIEAAQEKAKSAKEGLWASTTPTPPWEYRASA